MVREGYSGATIEDSNKAKEKFTEKSEKITIADVPATIITAPKNLYISIHLSRYASQAVVLTIHVLEFHQ